MNKDRKIVYIKWSDEGKIYNAAGYKDSEDDLIIKIVSTKGIFGDKDVLIISKKDILEIKELKIE